MKHWAIFGLLMLLLFSVPIIAQTGISATFAWTTPVPAVSGVEIRITPAGGNGNPITYDCTTNNPCTVPGLSAGSWSALGVPYNLIGTSKLYGPTGTAVNFTVPTIPGPLNGFSIKSIQVTLGP
jgi:hypothetical protein